MRPRIVLQEKIEERKWIEPVKGVNETALDVPHSSVTTDLYRSPQTFMRKTLPLNLQDLVAFAVAVLLPLVPALLYVLPLEVILPELFKLLL